MNKSIKHFKDVNLYSDCFTLEQFKTIIEHHTAKIEATNKELFEKENSGIATVKIVTSDIIDRYFSLMFYRYEYDSEINNREKYRKLENERYKKWIKIHDEIIKDTDKYAIYSEIAQKIKRYKVIRN